MEYLVGAELALEQDPEERQQNHQDQVDDVKQKHEHRAFVDHLKCAYDLEASVTPAVSHPAPAPKKKPRRSA